MTTIVLPRFQRRMYLEHRELLQGLRGAVGLWLPSPAQRFVAGAVHLPQRSLLRGGDAMTLAAVRELHAPMPEYGGVRCGGCDVEGWESEQPEWPCRTAKLVYSADEIAAVLALSKAADAQYRMARDLVRQKREAELAAGAPRTMGESIAAIYAPIIEEALKSAAFKLLPPP